MTPSRITLAPMFLIPCVLLAAGCISQPAAENQMGNMSLNVTTSIPIVTAAQTQCPIPKNMTPWIKIDPISFHGHHYIGDVFEITGMTSVEVNDTLLVYISKISNHPSQEHEIREIVRIQSRDCGGNIWSFSTNTSELHAGFYDVVVSTENLTISNWTGFDLTGKFTERGE
jgi:hypothetical protein